jgi:hypothetical protein
MKIYKKDRKFTADVLKKILSLKGIVNRDKTQLRKALNIIANQKIDSNRSGYALGIKA